MIHLQAHCTAASSSDDMAVAVFADGRTVDADIVVGADGINSAVRDGLFGAQSPGGLRPAIRRRRLPETMRDLPYVRINEPKERLPG